MLANIQLGGLRAYITSTAALAANAGDFFTQHSYPIAAQVSIVSLRSMTPLANAGASINVQPSSLAALSAEGIQDAAIVIPLYIHF